MTSTELQSATGLGADRLHQLEQAGVIARSGRNQWLAVETLGALVRHYRDEARWGHRSAADAALREARADEIRVRTQARRRELIPLVEAHEALETFIGCVLVELSGHAARCTRDIALRRVIDDEVWHLRDRVSKKLAAMAQALRAGIPLDQVQQAADGDGEAPPADLSA
jgi:hypothetical protein